MKSPSKPRITPQEAAEQLIECGKRFYERGWMWGSAGNLSIKLSQDPLKLAITPSGVNKGHLTKDDILTLEEGRQPKTARPDLVVSSDALIHQTVHRALPGCGAVFHVHSMYATLMSAIHGHPRETRSLLVPWFEMMKGVGVGDEESAEVAILPNWADVGKIAQEVSNYLTRARDKAIPVVLLCNHGLVGWGTTADQARNHVEIIEYVCEYLYRLQLVKR